MRIPRLPLSQAMHAIAALGVLLALWSWKFRSYGADLRFDGILAFVTLSSLVVIAATVTAITQRNRRIGRFIKGLEALNLLLAAWFVAVDWQWHYLDCACCGHHWSVFEYRVLGVPVHREEGDHQQTAVELIAADLGVPCSHPQHTRVLAHRRLGLCLETATLCALRLGDPPWYPPCAAQAVRLWQAQDPGFARKYQKRVLEDHDPQFWRSFALKLYDACPGQVPKTALRPGDSSPE